MASFKFLLTACVFAGALLLQAECACDATAWATCGTTLSSAISALTSGSSEWCTAYKTYITCTTTAGCTSESAYTTFKNAYDSACGGAEQYLLSWPLYMVVMALTLRRVYNSME